MNHLSPAPAALADLLDLVETALATLARRLPDHVGRDDLASVGKIALIAAAMQCDGSAEDVRAYCFVRVRGSMLDELRRLDPLSRQGRAHARAVTAAQATLTSRLGRAPTAGELAAATRLTVAQVTAAQNALAAETELMEVEWNSLPDTAAPSPAESVELADLGESLRRRARPPAAQPSPGPAPLLPRRRHA